MCRCAVDKTQLDSDIKCKLAIRPILVVPISIRNGSEYPRGLCRFSDYTKGVSAITAEDVINCTLETVIGSVYTLKVEILARRALHDGDIFDCTPTCLNATFGYGLHKHFTGIPITFGNISYNF